MLPGYTHLQRAQPVMWAHWCLAYFEMFSRDSERLADAMRRINVLPLGSGALAGTAFRVDRQEVAKELGFDGSDSEQPGCGFGPRFCRRFRQRVRCSS